MLLLSSPILPPCYVRLLFPFVGVKSKRFDFNKETKWSYMGREKFKELLDSLHDEQWHHETYGSRGMESRIFWPHSLIICPPLRTELSTFLTAEI